MIFLIKTQGVVLDLAIFLCGHFNASIYNQLSGRFFIALITIQDTCQCFTDRFWPYMITIIPYSAKPLTRLLLKLFPVCLTNGSFQTIFQFHRCDLTKNYCVFSPNFGRTIYKCNCADKKKLSNNGDKLFNNLFVTSKKRHHEFTN